MLAIPAVIGKPKHVFLCSLTPSLGSASIVILQLQDLARIINLVLSFALFSEGDCRKVDGGGERGLMVDNVSVAELIPDMESTCTMPRALRQCQGAGNGPQS